MLVVMVIILVATFSNYVSAGQSVMMIMCGCVMVISVLARRWCSVRNVEKKLHHFRFLSQIIIVIMSITIITIIFWEHCSHGLMESTDAQKYRR